MSNTISEHLRAARAEFAEKIAILDELIIKTDGMFGGGGGDA